MFLAPKTSSKSRKITNSPSLLIFFHVLPPTHEKSPLFFSCFLPRRPPPEPNESNKKRPEGRVERCASHPKRALWRCDQKLSRQACLLFVDPAELDFFDGVARFLGGVLERRAHERRAGADRMRKPFFSRGPHILHAQREQRFASFLPLRQIPAFLAAQQFRLRARKEGLRLIHFADHAQNGLLEVAVRRLSGQRPLNAAFKVREGALHARIP